MSGGEGDAGRTQGGPRPITLPFAGQPDIVLAAQKDQIHLRELREAVYSVAEGAFGPQTTSGAKPELSLFADFLYNFLTTAKGRQTLGEEYCDLFYFEPNGRTRIAANHRQLLALFLALGPYIMARLALGGWSSLFSALRRETARERAAALARRQQQQRAAMAMSANASRGYSFVVIAGMILSGAAILSRLHLAAFYWKGDYLDPIKRLFQARYVFTREPAAQRPTYWILSVFILFQLGLQGSSTLIEFVQRQLGVTPASALRAGDCVPSLTTDDEEDRQSRLSALFSNPCGICLSPLKSPSCPPCGHVYCYECIVESCVAKSECPLCRRQASPQSVQCIYV